MADKKQKESTGIVRQMIDDASGDFAKLQKQPQDPKKKKKDPEAKRAVGVQLKNKEWDRLAEIAKELGHNRHELTIYILRDFIERYNQGERPKTRTKTVTVLDPGA